MLPASQRRGAAGMALVAGITLTLTGCVSVKEITGDYTHVAVEGNPYCVTGRVFVVQSRLMVSIHRSFAGFVVFADPYTGAERTDYGPDDRLGAKGFLRPGDKLVVERVYWVRHNNVGDHLQIRARVLCGLLVGTRIDIRGVQDPKYLRQSLTATDCE